METAATGRQSGAQRNSDAPPVQPQCRLQPPPPRRRPSRFTSPHAALPQAPAPARRAVTRSAAAGTTRKRWPVVYRQTGGRQGMQMEPGRGEVETGKRRRGEAGAGDNAARGRTDGRRGRRGGGTTGSAGTGRRAARGRDDGRRGRRGGGTMGGAGGAGAGRRAARAPRRRRVAPQERAHSLRVDRRAAARVPRTRFGAPSRPASGPDTRSEEPERRMQ